MRAIEFFSGLGGWRRAVGGHGSVVAAYDVSETANAVYASSFGVAPRARELATVQVCEFLALGADAWLMSPPCQPFCRRGGGLGLGDPRSAAFLHLMDALLDARPTRLVLENVEGFLESEAFSLLCGRLSLIGLGWRTYNLCPTQFGLPNRRPRVFVVASADGAEDVQPPSIEPRAIGDFLDREEDEGDGLYVPDETLARHGPGMDIVGSDSTRSACFIGGYGKVYVGGGSFLRTHKGVRRFSPAEIARLLGHPPDLRFPQGMPLNTRYRLLGNGLSLPVAEWVLGRLGTRSHFSPPSGPHLG
jgi:DNA (cytosine-5)-methyltransferase 1/tRNA (cytosine38-C5)-methyltransferase